MKLIKALFSRLSLIILMVILEMILLLILFSWIGDNASWIETIIHVLSAMIVLFIIKDSRHLSSDMFWIVMIVLFPVPGTIFYILAGADIIHSDTFNAIGESTRDSFIYYKQDKSVLRRMDKEAPDLKGQFHYISDTAGFPFYENTGYRYYGSGEEGFKDMIKELKKAKRFIFLEYFIIEEGQMWDSMLEILTEKARKGLDVRVLYDDLGSFFTLSADYAARLEEKGIKCIPFNRINPILGAIMNHRDHRKIMVIDGETAFSGGINLADEYINAKERFGYWKDNVIKVKGEAVWSFTVMFLSHWNAFRKEDDDFRKFYVKAEKTAKNDGYIAVYGETPLDREITAQNIYMGILNGANDYCYIYTPYLIIDTEMTNALILAAKHGVDVRIITPGIPDKKLVWQITRSYYKALIEGGVKIYEYTPGFVHSKVFVSDDRTAVVGTINLDYRSLYLHFENGTYLYGSRRVKDVKKDFLEALEASHEVRLDECRSGPIKEFFLSVLRLFAPMM
ncbi:MAG: cardiolipin synthase, partial [Erysipelotrichaceae bacterium]|nr:cardiolipin synthase [Erysipelotrichaceae bacterium]